MLYKTKLLHSKKYNIAVVSIGNISVGGTGKTPFAEFLIRTLLEHNLSIAYLSRGYKRKTRGFRIVQPNHDTFIEAGDEALQVANKFKQIIVAVCENRSIGIKKLISKHSLDIIILDDAFQHLKIQRDFDIITIDANRPPWKDKLLPAGWLREPLSTIKNAQLVVVNKILEEGKIKYFKNHLKAKLIFTKNDSIALHPFNQKNEFIPLANNLKHTCIVFCGLGNNEQFILELKKIGLIIIRNYRYTDHYSYKPSDLKRITRRFEKLNSQPNLKFQPLIITTEKDYFRLINLTWFQNEYLDFPFYYLEIKLSIIRGKDHFLNIEQQILSKIASYDQ